MSVSRKFRRGAQHKQVVQLEQAISGLQGLGEAPVILAEVRELVQTVQRAIDEVSTKCRQLEAEQATWQKEQERLKEAFVATLATLTGKSALEVSLLIASHYRELDNDSSSSSQENNG